MFEANRAPHEMGGHADSTESKEEQKELATFSFHDYAWNIGIGGLGGAAGGAMGAGALGKASGSAAETAFLSGAEAGAAGCMNT